MDQHVGITFQRLDNCLAGGNPLAPELMIAGERLAEVAQILAAGLLRLRRRESEKPARHLENIRLDFSPDGSVHATARQQRQVRR